MSLSPIALIFISSAGVITFIFAFCYRRRMEKINRGRNLTLRIERSTTRTPDHCAFPDFFDSEAQDQYSNNKAGIYIHPTLSSRSLHVDAKFDVGHDDDDDDELDDLAYRNSNPPLLGVSTNQSYNRIRSPSPAVDARLPPRDIELSTLPAVHPSTSNSSRHKHQQLLRTTTSPSLSSSTATRPEILPAVEDGIDRRVEGYFQKQSSLPRPLGLQRPVIADTSVTSSSRVVANIVRASPTYDPKATSEIEPTVVFLKKAGPSPETSSNGRTRAMSDSRTGRQGRVSPLHRTAFADSTGASCDHHELSMKEELHRKGPQAIIPESISNSPQVRDEPKNAKNNALDTDLDDNDGDDDDDRSLNTAFLMLQPYMSPSEQVPPVPSDLVTDATAEDAAALNTFSRPQQSSSSASPSFAPTRPPRRVPSITRKQRPQKQSSQQQQQPANDPPKPLSSILELPTPPSTSHITVTTSSASLHDQTESLPESFIILPNPVAQLPPPSLPPIRGLGESLHLLQDRGSFSTNSVSGSERTISPVPSNTSSNLSTVLSIGSSASFASSTTFATTSGFPETGKGVSIKRTVDYSPALSPTMSLASPTFATVLSPTIPSSSGWSSSKNRSMDDLWSRDEHSKGGRKEQEQHGGQENAARMQPHAWLHNPPSGPTLGKHRKRVNDPHLGDAGARLSQFNYDE